MQKIYWHKIVIKVEFQQAGLMPPIEIMPTIGSILNYYGLSEDKNNISNVLNYSGNAFWKMRNEQITRVKKNDPFAEFNPKEELLIKGQELYVPIPWMIDLKGLVFYGTDNSWYSQNCGRIRLNFEIKRYGPPKLNNIQFFQTVFSMYNDERKKLGTNINASDIKEHHIDPYISTEASSGAMDAYPYYAPVGQEREGWNDSYGMNPKGVNNRFRDYPCRGSSVYSFGAIVSLGIVDTYYRILRTKDGKTMLYSDQKSNTVTIYDSYLWGGDFTGGKPVPFGPVNPSSNLLNDHLNKLKEGVGKNGVSFKKNDAWRFFLADKRRIIGNSNTWIGYEKID